MPKSRSYNVRVIKVSRDRSSPPRPQAFPKMPRLYLELLENKAKIKQNLINKEYVPEHSSIGPEINHFSTKETEHDSLSISSPESRDESSPESDSESDYKLEGSSDDDDVSVRLKELLEDSDDDLESVSTYKKHRKHRRDKYYDQQPTNEYEPPTLSQLEAQGQYQRRKEFPDINHVTKSEEEEEEEKRELLFKFELLKKSYPVSSIPEFSIHSDLNAMKRSYETTVRRLSLDSTVESYKTYLIGVFMLVEYVCGGWLGFDMQGFTQQQIISMSSYERLLIELGEKSYVPSGSKWPVELRLLFLIIMNTAFFIVSKMIMRKTGSNLMNMINSMNTAPATSAPPRRKRRMRGPDIDIDDIPDLDEVKEEDEQIDLSPQ